LTEVPLFIRELFEAHYTALLSVVGYRIVVVSTAFYAQPDTNAHEIERLDAAVYAVGTIRAAGLPMVGLVDARSHPSVAVRLGEAGAIWTVTTACGFPTSERLKLGKCSLVSVRSSLSTAPFSPDTVRSPWVCVSVQGLRRKSFCSM